MTLKRKAWYENQGMKHVNFFIRHGTGVRDIVTYDVPPGGRCQGPELYKEAFRRQGLTLIPDPPLGDGEHLALRDDGPTLEEFVSAGYLIENYPPQGYAEKDSAGLRAYRARMKAAGGTPPAQLVGDLPVAERPYIAPHIAAKALDWDPVAAGLPHGTPPPSGPPTFVSDPLPLPGLPEVDTSVPEMAQPEGARRSRPKTKEK